MHVKLSYPVLCREKRRRSRSELPPGYTHLIVLVHGLAGDANDWAALCEEARASQALPHAWFHSSLVNERQRTIEGIDTCGERLVGELMGLVERSTDLTHISFVGHSMGGLISRCHGISRVLIEPDQGQGCFSQSRGRDFPSGRGCPFPFLIACAQTPSNSTPPPCHLVLEGT